MIDPAEEAFRSRTALPPSRENAILFLLGAVVLAVFAAFPSLHFSPPVIAFLAALFLIGLARKAWQESHVTYVVGQDHFGVVTGSKRQTWPRTDLVRVAPMRRPAAFGRENAYVLLGQGDKPLLVVRPVLLPDGELDRLWARLGVHP